jgi:hypothetical protein
MSLGSQRLGCLMQGSDKKAFECQNFMPDTYDFGDWHFWICWTMRDGIFS